MPQTPVRSIMFKIAESVTARIADILLMPAPALIIVAALPVKLVDRSVVLV
jgi:hypothetical protein